MAVTTSPDLSGLGEAHLEIRERARRLAASVADRADAADRATTVDAGMRAALRASGLCRLAVPAAFGGSSASVDPLAVVVVREALMGVSAHLDSMFGMQGVGSFALSIAGEEPLQRRWLPRVAELDAIAALALTEADVGSDLREISTTLTRDGDELVIDGAKAFITNAGAADFYSVLAREDDGHSLVLVPADADGLTVTAGPDLIAPHVLGSLSLDGVRVDADHRIGAPGAGFKLALATLACFRASVAGASVGLAQAALEEALAHVCRREQFGAPLIKLGAVSQSMAGCWTKIEAARSLTYRAATAAAGDPLGALALSSMAKYTASETAGEVVDRCVQVMGRFGLVDGSKIERLYRNARPLRIYEGSSEVLLDALARRLARERVLMRLDLEGRVALVTGASRGLGASMARGLSGEGATVVAVARSGAQLEQLARDSAAIDPLVWDLSEPHAVDRLVAQALERHGRLDVLVNNAGIAPAGVFYDQDPAEWRRTFELNVITPMVLAQAAGRHFRSRGEGKVINVASTTGVRGKPGLVGYSASKGAMVRMTEALAAEWAGDGIQVNAIAPGAFATEAQQAVIDDPELLARRVRRIPARRMADPDEIVELTCYLASPRSAFVTGAVFVIDGGESGKL